MNLEASVVPGKTCGSCAMCCKVYEFTGLAKTPKGWCENFKPGTGCSIYADRPDSCRAYFCNWMLLDPLGPEWKPDSCKFVMTYDPSRSVMVQVDPNFPTAWRSKPFYTAFREWAVRLKAENRFIFIFVGRNLTVITAEGEYDLGPFDRSYELKMTKELRNGTLFDIPRKLPRTSAIPG